MNYELGNSYLLKHAWRYISRMRTYSIINVVGLIIALTGTIIIARYVHQELTVDDYIPHIDRTCLLCVSSSIGDNKFHTSAGVQNDIRVLFENYVDPMSDPGIECYTQFDPYRGGYYRGIKVEGTHRDAHVYIVDSMFLQMLPRKVVMGTCRMEKKTDAVVTRSFARNVWQDEYPIGKKMQVADQEVTVIGVVEAAPTKANYEYDVLLHKDLIEFDFGGDIICRLKEGVNYREVNARLPEFSHKKSGIKCRYRVFPLKKAYFGDSSMTKHGEFLKSGNRQGLNALMLAGGLLLCIALFNFLNLFGILMVHRRRSFDIRKVYGAGTRDTFCQIFLENLMLSALAVSVAWIFITLLSPLMDRYYGLDQIACWQFDIGLSLGIALLFPLLISLPTALRFHRSTRISNMRAIGMGETHVLSRYLSLGIQYVFTFFLIVISSFAMRQLYYMLYADMGYDTKDILTFNLIPQEMETKAKLSEEEFASFMQKHQELSEQIDEMSKRIKSSPLFQYCICSWSGNMRASLTTEKDKSEMRPEKMKVKGSSQEPISVVRLTLTEDACNVYGIHPIEGRMPNMDKLGPDGHISNEVLLTESAKKQLGITNLNETIIERTDIKADNTAEVAGIIKDIRYIHMAVQNEPIVVYISNSSYRTGIMTARVQPGKRQEALKFLQDLCEEANGTGSVLEYEWIEDDLAKVYQDDARTARTYTTFALLAILVSCMGLFGISLYDVQHRRREIAIRRVNGAQTIDIYRLVLRRYLVALVIAIAVGTPLVLYALRFYIQGYAHHVALTPWYFIFAALLMAFLTLCTIAWQVGRAIKENPADVMKSE